MKIIKSKYFLLLQTLIVPGLVSGPFIPDLILTISSLIFILCVIKYKIYEIFQNKYFYFLVLFYISILLSSLFSDEILFSLKSSFFYFRVIIYYFLLVYLFNFNKEKFIKYYFYTFLITLTILCVDGFYQYKFGNNLLGFEVVKSFHKYRISGLFGEELIMGSFIARMFPVFTALYLFLKIDNKYFSIFFITLFVALDVLVFISGERTAFLFLNLSTIFIILFCKSLRYFRLATFVLSTIIIIFILNNNNYVKERMLFDTLRSLGISDKEKIITEKNNEFEDKIHIFSQGHDSLIRTAFKMFLDKPLIGHGPRMFRLKCDNDLYRTGKHYCDTHPHNYYIQLLAETGLLGATFIFVALIYLLTNIFFILFKKKKVSDFEICLISSVLIFLWPLSPNGNFFNNWMLVINSIPVGFYLASQIKINT